LSGSASIVALIEGLPPHLRSTTFALAYAVAQALFGSSTQSFVTWLIHATNNPLMLGWCAFTVSAIGLIAKSRMPETAPRRLRRGNLVSTAS